MSVKLICVGGARPNFVKLAPLVRALEEDPAFDPVLVHTGQHYDERMSGNFFRDLGMRPPAHNLEVGSGSHAQQTAEVIEEKPAGVVVVGDVNSTLASALVAVKLQIRVVHVEAGLRSFDRSMPEEINRVLTDSVSRLLLVTEESGVTNLIAEGVSRDRIKVIGNLMIDTLLGNLERARQSKIHEQLRLRDGEPYGVVTLHRPANVDESAKLEEVLGALADISLDIPLYFPVHPRTRSQLERLTLPSNARITFLDPLGYLDFLGLMAKSSLVMTDSGGIQEETTALGVPCLTLRDNTERPVTIHEGTNYLAGTRRDGILAAWRECRANPKTGRVPRFWDGRAAQRAIEALRAEFAAGSAPTS